MLKRKHILPILGALLILIQFFRIDKTNEAVDGNLDLLQTQKPTKEMSAMIRNACYDCHSDEVKYPWYTNVAPISWWIKGHINNGRKHLNFSIWNSYSKDKRAHKIDECVEMLENRWMPLTSYVWMHPEAKMTDQDNEEMIAFFKSLRSE